MIQPENVLTHWYAPIDNFQFSTVEFYDRIQAELEARHVPRLRARRVEYHEGSALSDKRLYLRLARERYSFEICAAPFGTGYFFSLRLVELPRGGWIQLILLLLAVAAGLGGAFFLGIYALFMAAHWFWWVLIGVIATGLTASAVRYAKRDPADDPPERRRMMPDFDAFFLGLPVIGAWYEAHRKETFYRHDTRMLFLTLITDIVKALVDEITSTKGVRLLESFEYDPILGALYKRQKKEFGATLAP